MTPLFAQVINTPGTNAPGTNTPGTNAAPADSASGEPLAEGAETGTEAVAAEPTALSEFLDSGAIGLLLSLIHI